MSERQLRAAADLSYDALTGLIKGDLDLIWCRGYSPPGVYEAVSPRIETACDASTYTLTPDFQCVGVSIGEANESLEKAEQYVAEGAATTRFIRESLFAGVGSPVDRLLSQLDALWPTGAEVALTRAAWPCPAQRDQAVAVGWTGEPSYRPTKLGHTRRLRLHQETRRERVPRGASRERRR